MRARAKDLDQLADEQGVSPVGDIGTLRGEPIDDDNFDDFMRIVRSARGAKEAAPPEERSA